MRSIRPIAIFICFAAATGAYAATITLKTGAVIEGAVQGDIVQRSELLESTKDGETTYLATYTIVRGRDILSIGRKGVLSDGYVTVVSANKKGAPLDDAYVAASAPRDQGLVFGLSGPFALVMNVNLKKVYESALKQPDAQKSPAAAIIPLKDWEGAVRFPLLGELRRNEENGEWEIHPAIRVSSGDSTTSYAIADIAAFVVPERRAGDQPNDPR